MLEMIHFYSYLLSFPQHFCCLICQEYSCQHGMYSLGHQSFSRFTKYLKGGTAVFLLKKIKIQTWTTQKIMACNDTYSVVKQFMWTKTHDVTLANSIICKFDIIISGNTCSNNGKKLDNPDQQQKSKFIFRDKLSVISDSVKQIFAENS